MSYTFHIYPLYSFLFSQIVHEKFLSRFSDFTLRNKSITSTKTLDLNLWILGWDFGLVLRLCPQRRPKPLVTGEEITVTTLHCHSQKGLGAQRDRGGQRGNQRGYSRY